MQSKAKSVSEYLSDLPEDRRSIVKAVRKIILQNLDPKFEEGMQYGMIGYYVPHRIYPAGYHCDPKQPLPYLCLASQKNYLSLYTMCLYSDGKEEKWFRTAWAKSGKKLNMGKCCIRFKCLEDLALDVVGQLIQRNTVQTHIAQYEKLFPQSRRASKVPPSAKRKPAGRKK